MLRVKVSHEQWIFAAELARLASAREGRWITTHGYLCQVLRDHLDAESMRLGWTDDTAIDLAIRDYPELERAAIMRRPHKPKPE